MENATKLLKNPKINEHIIKLEKSKQLFFRLIYNLSLVKLEILKTYIEINLANGFIQLFKSSLKYLFFLIKNQIEVFAFK